MLLQSVSKLVSIKFRELHNDLPLSRGELTADRLFKATRRGWQEQDEEPYALRRLKRLVMRSLAKELSILPVIRKNA